MEFYGVVSLDCQLQDLYLFCVFLCPYFVNFSLNPFLYDYATLYTLEEVDFSSEFIDLVFDPLHSHREFMEILQ